MKKRLKKSVVYSLYAFAFILLALGIAIPLISMKSENDTNFQYASLGILDYEQEVKVVNTDSKIQKPFDATNISVVKSYYDYQGESTSQENSIIYYEGTYMQSSGVSYSNGESFDVLSILDGKVSEVKEDLTLGNSITIEHDNGVVSIYQSISDISVKEGDTIVAGQVLAKSSTSNISTELNNHLYFELIINGENVNPELYYGKSVNEL